MGWLYNLLLRALLLLTVLLSELLDPHMAPKCCFSFRVGSISLKAQHLDDFWTEGSWSFSVCHPLRCYWSITRWKLYQIQVSGSLILHQEQLCLQSWSQMWQGRVVPPGCSMCCSLNLPLAPRSGPSGFTCPRTSVPALFCSLSCIFCTFFRNFSSIWRSKASCLHVSWARRSHRNGYFPPNERELQKITWDVLLQTPPTSNQRTNLSVLWLEWYFQKSLVLCLILLITVRMTHLGAGFSIPKDQFLVHSHTSMQ